jgi:hypothetical protein
VEIILPIGVVKKPFLFLAWKLTVRLAVRTDTTAKPHKEAFQRDCIPVSSNSI